MRNVSELLVPGFGRPVLLCRGRMPRARGIAVYVYEMDMEHFAKSSLSVCGYYKMLVFRVCGAR